MTYLRVFLDYLDAIEPLDDAERGRLFTALLTYAQTNQVPALQGNEKFVFPMMKAQVDRDRAEAHGLSEARSAAGKKGAQARLNKAKQTKQLPDLPGKSSKDKDKDKDKDDDKDDDKYDGKDDDKDKDAARAGAQSPAAAAVLRAYLDKINPLMSERVRDELAGFAEVMRSECCLRAFDIALDAKKASWPYIRAILQAKQEQGVRCLADWDALEARRMPAERRRGGEMPSMACVAPEDAGNIRADLDRMKKFLAEIKAAPGEEAVW